MAEDVWLAPTAQVIGDVVVGREASIWFSAIVRGDNEPIVIGEASYECLDVFLATAGIGTKPTTSAACLSDSSLQSLGLRAECAGAASLRRVEVTVARGFDPR